MTVQDLIDKLSDVTDKSVPVILSYVNVTWEGGCDTCGYGAVENRDAQESDARNAYDMGSRVVIETIRN